MTRWLITGGAGQVGVALAEVLGDAATVLERSELDITSRTSVREALHRYRPDVVVNAAAWTDVDGAEAHADQAHAVNAIGAGLLAHEASTLGLRLVHLSTDYVFDGRRTTPYSVHDVPHPLNEYGRGKLAGERLVLEGDPAALVVRTSWVFSHVGHNFVITMSSRARQSLASRVVDDQTGSPTYAIDLAAAVVSMASAGHQGLVHWTNAGVTTWFDFARQIYVDLGADPELVTRSSTAELDRPAPRPMSSVLQPSESLLGPRRPWQEALLACLDRMTSAKQ